MEVKFNLFNLKQDLQKLHGREFSYAAIGDAVGLHRNTVERIASNKTERVSLLTLGKLLLFFHQKGMKITLDDLITINLSDAEQNDHE